jgi:hypothetical protein
MRRLLLIGTLAMLSVGATAGVAAATPGDFAAGGGFDGVGQFNFAAHQTAATQASGHMSYSSPTQEVRAGVLCLNVVGNLAFILGEIDPARSSGIPGGSTRVVFEVQDGPGADGFSVFLASFSLGCRQLPFEGVEVVRGNVLVHDNQP